MPCDGGIVGGRGHVGGARSAPYANGLPLLPVREGKGGREKRAGVMRANATAKVNLTKQSRSTAANRPRLIHGG
jgi:hypothetical protein